MKTTEDHRLAKAFLEQCPAVLWTARQDGTFCEIYGDPSAIFGKTAQDLKGRSPQTALPADAAAAKWQARFARALAGETLMLREHEHETIWDVTLFPIRHNGLISYVGGMAQRSAPWSMAEQQLRHTVLRALKSQEFERKTASQFLHDSVGQNLTALGLQLDLVRMDLETFSPTIGARIAEIQKMLETMMEEVREYSYELNPSTVERAGLRPALDRLVSRIRQRFTGSVRLVADPSLKLDPKVASALFHIAQEAVQNAVLHASCSVIEIAVKSTRKGAILEVKDNGRGFDPGDVVGVRRGLGLLSMEHYAAQAGFELAITCNPEGGTLVRVARQ
ncbi:MAG: sensor histidine kinase [Acidobacteriia bacterium]|nr:sensor histidine kinase [Terriglobia bacterium]